MEIALDGLKLTEIVDALRAKEVGLWAHIQNPLLQEPYNNTELAMRAYVQSRIPLIVELDLGRMFGNLPENEIDNPEQPGLLQRNNPELKVRIEELNKVLTHVVVLVGCHRTNKDTFYLNCSATYPVIEATLAELRQARSYNSQEFKGTENANLRDFRFVSVTPKKVRLHLLRADADEGLLEYVARIQNSQFEVLTKVPKLEPGNTSSYRLGEFRLVELGSALESVDMEFLGEAGHAESELCTLMALAAADMEISWVWIQKWNFVKDGEEFTSIWLWNAEFAKYEHGNDSLRHRLAACFVLRDGSWSDEYLRDDPAV